MKEQTYTGTVIWMIVDDGDPVTTDFITDDFREGWTIQKIYPKPVWQKGQNTQGRNLAAGIREIKKLDPELIFIVEDDDYYSPPLS